MKTKNAKPLSNKELGILAGMVKDYMRRQGTPDRKEVAVALKLYKIAEEGR